MVGKARSPRWLPLCAAGGACESIAAAQLADLPKHEQTLERIRSLGRHAQRIAVRVAAGSQPYKGFNSKIANDTLRTLRDAGIIDQTAPRRWHIIDPLLRNFLVELDRLQGDT